MQVAGENGVIIVEDGMALAAVRYQKHLRRRDGVEIVPASDTESFSEMVNSRRPLILVPLGRDNPSATLPARLWHRKGDLYTSGVTGTQN